METGMVELVDYSPNELDIDTMFAEMDGDKSGEIGQEEFHNIIDLLFA